MVNPTEIEECDCALLVKCSVRRRLTGPCVSAFLMDMEGDSGEQYDMDMFM